MARQQFGNFEYILLKYKSTDLMVCNLVTSQITSQFVVKMTGAPSYILALAFIFLPSVSSVNKGRTKTFQEIAYGSAVDYSIVKTSYPFMVRIIMDGSFRCGGALISDRWVNSDRLVNPYILAQIIHILYISINISFILC